MTDRTATPHAMTAPTCIHCGTPLCDLSTAFLSVYGRGFRYPGDWPETHAEFTHRDCEPPNDAGYHVELARLRQDGLDGPSGWVTHLRGKTWWNPAVEQQFHVAHALAVQLAQPAAGVRAASPSKPASAPRALRVLRSKDPRAISTGTRTRVMERDEFRCRRCGAGPDDARLVVDHVIPVARGGTADLANLQVLCEPCNAGKRDRIPHPHDERGRA